jgi:hypothetical protein
MRVWRFCTIALSAIVATAFVCDPASPATGDKQLARVKGIVGYQDTATSAFKPIFGQLDLPDDAFAVTKQNAAAILRLSDSSEIDIGERTTVQVGQFNAVSTGNQNTIALNNGALHFVIRHPQGGQSNYKFVTATSQIAVRGTEGFLVAGPQGTQIVCVQCAAGDVTVQVGQQTLTILSNQTLTILGTNPLTATTSLTTNSAVNNPAINQFNHGSNPLNPSPSSNGFDPTNSLSGTGASGGGAALSGGTVGALAGAAAAGIAVAATNHSSTPASTSGPIIVQVSYPAANATYPVPFSWPFSQSNATSQASVSCTPSSVITCSLAQQLTNGTLTGTVVGSFLAPGAFMFSLNASGYTLPPTTMTVYGGVTASATPLTFNALGTQTLTITQAPNGTALSATSTCTGGAALKLLSSSGQSPWALQIQATAAPSVNPPPTNACTVTVTGQGQTAVSTLVVPVNITSTSIGVSAHVRKPL